MNSDKDFTPYTKIHSKWIVHLNVKCKVIEPLEDNKGENRNDLEFGDAFLDNNTKNIIHERNNGYAGLH